MPEETNIDLQNMDDDAISALATRCLDCLSLGAKVQAVLKSFHSVEEREELGTWLADEEDETEEE